MTTIDAPMLEALREVQYRLVGAEKIAQATIAAMQGVANSLNDEKNTLLKLVAREHGIPADQLQVDFLTGEVIQLPTTSSGLPNPPQKDS